MNNSDEANLYPIADEKLERHLSCTQLSLKIIFRESRILLEVKDSALKQADNLFDDLKAEVDSRLKEEKDHVKITLYDKFYENYTSFQERKKEYLKFSSHKQEERNLRAKQNIIEQIKQVVTSTIDQRNSLEQVKKLQSEWKKIGPIPQIYVNTLYKQYGTLINQFYSKKSIEYNLRELDKKKNLEKKIHLCKQIESLLAWNHSNQAVRQLDKFHKKFKSIGPVPKQFQKKIWQRFKDASDHLYEKQKKISQNFKEQIQKNIQPKRHLCSRIEQYATASFRNIEEWRQKTKEILEIQKEWENIGPLPRDISKSINKEFGIILKPFFIIKICSLKR